LNDDVGSDIDNYESDIIVISCTAGVAQIRQTRRIWTRSSAVSSCCVWTAERRRRCILIRKMAPQRDHSNEVMSVWPSRWYTDMAVESTAPTAGSRKLCRWTTLGSATVKT